MWCKFYKICSTALHLTFLNALSVISCLLGLGTARNQLDQTLATIDTPQEVDWMDWWKVITKQTLRAPG